MFANKLGILVERLAANRAIVQAFAGGPVLENALAVWMETPAVEATKVLFGSNGHHSTAPQFGMKNLFGADSMCLQAKVFHLMDGQLFHVGAFFVTVLAYYGSFQFWYEVRSGGGLRRGVASGKRNANG